MIVRRALVLVLLTLTGLVVETSVLGTMTLSGAKPELLLLMTVALAMAGGPAFGASAGFLMGLATDLVVNVPQGMSALTFTVLGYVVGLVRQQFQQPSAWLPMAMVFVATVAGVLFYGTLSIMLGQETLGATRIGLRAVLAAGYNALLTPFVFPIVRRLAAVGRPSSEVLR